MYAIARACALVALIAPLGHRAAGPGPLDVAAAPGCLWPPNHRMVLYTLDDLRAAIPGGPAVTQLHVVSVTSSEAALTPGSGNTSPDVRFGSGAFCVRSERAGPGPGRVYAVEVAGKDGQGALAQGVATIAVAHDQSGLRCLHPAPERIVADDDPRCVAKAPDDCGPEGCEPPPTPTPSPTPTPTPTPTPSPTPTPVSLEGGPAAETGGCGSGPATAAGGLLALLGLARRRRRS